MKIRKLASLGSASVLAISSLLTLTAPMIAHAAAQTCEWVGGTDLKFSTAANWANCGGGVPITGDIILFDKSTTNGAEVDLTNDLGVSLGGVESGAPATNWGTYKIDTISLASGAALSIAGTCSGNTIDQISYGTVNAAGALTVNTDAHSLYNAVLNVAGDITLENDNGFYALMAGVGSMISGNVIMASPTSTNCGGGGSGLISGSLLTGFTVNGLTVQKSAHTAIGNASYPITLGGGSGTAAPEIQLWGDTDAQQNYIDTTYTVSGNVTLQSDASVYAGDKTTVNFTGAITGSGLALTKDATSGGIVNFNFSSNSSSTVNGPQTNPVKTTTISDSQNTNINVVSNETTVLDGTRSNVAVFSGGVLKGSGTVTNGLNVQTGGVVAPGHSPGCLTVGSLFVSGTYQAEIGGTTPCSGYDQIKVTGTSNSVFLTGSTLEATLYNGFVPKVGQSYTIIDNQGSSAVNGTFTGIAEGGSYTNQGVTYSVTYKGGDGNDVVLTVTAVDASKLPKAPNTGMKLVAAHPMVALGFTTAAALFMMHTARRLRPAPARARGSRRK